jgi:hypothetical protein
MARMVPMDESDKPRANDHLVEPMYEALQEPEGSQSGKPVASKRWWLLALLVPLAWFLY